MLANGNERGLWRRTRVSEFLGIEYPIIQAPLGGYASQVLSATVSNLGGLGSLGALALGGTAIREAIEELRSLTQKPFAINLWVSTSDPDLGRVSREMLEMKFRQLKAFYAELGVPQPTQIEAKPQDFDVQVRAALDARCPVLSFFYGVPPRDVLKECQRLAIRTIGAATTPAEAMALEDVGIDIIVATGSEAGGHRGSFLDSPGNAHIGGLSLIPQVVDTVRAPVVAAGGIADGRGLIAALALGAEGVQMGTAFLACKGSGVGDGYRATLLSPGTKRTELTDALTGREARGLSNRLMQRVIALHDAALPFPLQHAVVQTVARPAAEQNKGELMTIWAGQSAGLCRFEAATELMNRLVGDANQFFGDPLPSVAVRLRSLAP